jgi:hypothetical protein
MDLKTSSCLINVHDEKKKKHFVSKEFKRKTRFGFENSNEILMKAAMKEKLKFVG